MLETEWNEGQSEKQSSVVLDEFNFIVLILKSLNDSFNLNVPSRSAI